MDNFKAECSQQPRRDLHAEVRQTDSEVYTSDNIVDLLDIRVKDNTLYIGFKEERQRIL